MAEETGKSQQPETEAKSDNAAQSLTIKLRKAIIANGDEVSSLTFREPTAADIERVGSPVELDFFQGETPKTTFNTKIMTQMMAVLAAVPPSTIRQMHPRDWNTAAWSLASFFMPEM